MSEREAFEKWYSEQHYLGDHKTAAQRAWQAAYRAGIAAERERCARVCESFLGGYNAASENAERYRAQDDRVRQCAAAIRRDEYGGDGSPLCNYEHAAIRTMRPDWDAPEEFGAYFVSDRGGDLLVPCPYGKPGDRLWVRETHLFMRQGRAIAYRANLDAVDAAGLGAMYGGWKPAIHLPRLRSRITLEITDVRVERLQEISGKDIVAEGAVERPHNDDYFGRCPVSAFDGKVYLDLLSLWAAGWDSINAKRAPWSSNPWVWAISFRRLP